MRVFSGGTPSSCWREQIRPASAAAFMACGKPRHAGKAHSPGRHSLVRRVSWFITSFINPEQWWKVTKYIYSTTVLSDMEQEVQQTVSWKKFFVVLAGQTKGAHLTIVAKLESSGQNEVESAERSDYILLFCPVASRVGTDVSEALEIVPGGKPIILVVMHHTFSPNYVLAESRRQVNNPSVRLTVDCLFHEGQLLTCERNDRAWSEIKRFLGVSDSWIFRGKCQRNRWLVLAVVAVVTVGVVIILATTLTPKK